MEDPGPSEEFIKRIIKEVTKAQAIQKMFGRELKMLVFATETRHNFYMILRPMAKRPWIISYN